MAATVTPMMQQYQEAKAACPGAVLLFRMGDFYELFFEDAKIASRVLGLALTTRDKGDDPVPMAGFPYHQLENYLRRLIAAGQRAAICEQVEDPRQAKGLVRREVTRIVTAGTVTDDALLDPRECNFLAAVAPGEPAGLAWVELSTGRFHAASFPAAALSDELSRIGPAECLLAEDDERLLSAIGSVAATGSLSAPDTRWQLTRRPAWSFAVTAAREALSRHFGTATLEGFGFDDADTPAIRAAGAVLEYLTETQKSRLDHIERLTPYRPGDTLEIDQATRRSLEITRTLREGKREGSLLDVIDRTVSPMGARQLGDWIANPLTDRPAIEARLDAVEELLEEGVTTRDIRESLGKVHDIERLLARVTTGRATPRDLGCLVRTLGVLPAVKAKLSARRAALLNDLEGRLDLCPEVRTRLDAALRDDLPLASHEGGLIKPGFHPPLDALRELAAGGKQWIARYQAEESARTGIPNLKVGFNKVFGYFLEVTNPHREKVPPHYIRKQTVKNAERYVTPELKEYEEKVLSADEKAMDLEHELFIGLRGEVAAASRRLLATASVLATIDALSALAELARQRRYCRPMLTDEPVLRIVDGRHPVLDLVETEGTFVPNDVAMGDSDGGLLLITGPNMAGKSTYIRQAALIALLAQAGSFVPARSAVIGVVDRLFARVGASDDLARGRSTFMVEMTETARILNTATARSLVILDEIGRGTSTYDGLSLAWSVVEYLHDRIGCRTLFATHYHELTDLAQSLPGVRNLNVSVREWQDEVVFLHKIVPGAADKSYGIHVARLAGVPREVLDRAREVLARLEQEHLDDQGRPVLARQRSRKGTHLQMTLFQAADHPVVERLRSVDIDATTPLEALALVKQWQEQVGEGATAAANDSASTGQVGVPASIGNAQEGSTAANGQTATTANGEPGKTRRSSPRRETLSSTN